LTGTKIKLLKLYTNTFKNHVNSKFVTSMFYKYSTETQVRHAVFQIILQECKFCSSMELAEQKFYFTIEGQILLKTLNFEILKEHQVSSKDKFSDRLLPQKLHPTVLGREQLENLQICHPI
jgi:hypothetical protein